MKITRQFILDGQSTRGGWSKAQIEQLGLAYPLQRGWIDDRIGVEIPDEQAEKFLALKDAHLSRKVLQDRLYGKFDF